MQMRCLDWGTDDATDLTARTLRLKIVGNRKKWEASTASRENHPSQKCKNYWLPC